MVAIALVLGVAGFEGWRQVQLQAAFVHSLRHGLRHNHFGEAFLGPGDAEVLRERLGFLREAEHHRDLVLALIAWIDEHIASDESYSVRATEILELGTAACEVHALAVGALEAFGVKARWIGGAKSSLGFGYLEVFLGGRWELFRLRSGGAPALGLSALELYRSSEPSLGIRNFWFKSRQGVRSWKGTVHPALLPLANAERHPELWVLFEADEGLEPPAAHLDAYVYGYAKAADAEWLLEDRVMAGLTAERGRLRARIERLIARWIVGFGAA